eukprot:356139-Chlamydomonas_euryale.AAC.2
MRAASRAPRPRALTCGTPTSATSTLRTPTCTRRALAVQTFAARRSITPFSAARACGEDKGVPQGGCGVGGTGTLSSACMWCKDEVEHGVRRTTPPSAARVWCKNAVQHGLRRTSPSAARVCGARMRCNTDKVRRTTPPSTARARGAKAFEGMNEEGSGIGRRWRLFAS